MKFWFSEGEVFTPPVGAPTSAEEAYKVAGYGALWEDYASTARAGFDPTAFDTWLGDTNANGEALVTTDQTGVLFTSGVTISSTVVLTNCVIPYVNCIGGAPVLNFCDLGDPTYGVNYPLGNGGVSQGNPTGYFGNSAVVYLTGTGNITLNNCKIECGIDGFRANGDPGSSLTINKCWINGYLMGARDPFQDSTGGASTSHCEAIQVNNPGAGTAITVTGSRFDWYLGIFNPVGEASRIGQPSSYDHATGLFTPGTWYSTPAPAASTELAGQLTYSPTAGANVDLQDYMMFAYGGAFYMNSGSVGAIDINNNWFRCYSNYIVAIDGGTKLSTVSVTNNVIERFPGLNTVVADHEYVRVRASASVDTWSGNVNEVGDPVAYNAE